MGSDNPVFPAAGFTFLRELAANNQREWFHPRKADFESRVKEPFVRLIEALNDELGEFAPEYRVEDPSKAVSRIHRDTRFSHDKSPYHSHVAVVLPKNGAAKHEVAGFFVGMHPDRVEVIGGAYVPGKEQLEALRRELVAEEAHFRALIAEPELAKAMGTLRGERLKRLPRGFESAGSAADLVTLTQAYFQTDLSPEAAAKPTVVRDIAGRFRAMTPFVRFLDEALAKAVT